MHYGACGCREGPVAVKINLSIKSKTISPANQQPGFTVGSDDDVIMRRAATDLENSHTQMCIFKY